MLSIGIIGLPNVGKSTLFNALTAGHAAVSNYPFTTIDSNVGVVAVPDSRLRALAELLAPEETNPTFIQFTDIAGLVRGASRGEGLGNQFLASIRAVDAVAHVVRCFRESEVAHVTGDVDPPRDIDVVETELLLADLEVMDRAIERRARNWKTSPRLYAAEEQRFTLYRQALASGTPLRDLGLEDDALQELKGLGILTSKRVIYVANISESELGDPTAPAAGRIKMSRIASSPVIVPLCARLEWELQQLEPEEREDFLNALEIHETGLDRLVKAAYGILGLITFYTIANNKLSAWAVRDGTAAPEAAGKIHSDMEKGFIRAQVTSFEALREHGSFQNLHKQGRLRTEGRDYKVRDGDIVEFLFG
ncbi:MAG: redox-regulated ATPase YchF [Acidobacteriota bacterium]